MCRSVEDEGGRRRRGRDVGGKAPAGERFDLRALENTAMGREHEAGGEGGGQGRQTVREIRRFGGEAR